MTSILRVGIVLLAMAVPIQARVPVQAIMTGLLAEDRPARHPRREEQVLRVPRELAGDGAAIELRYWRTGDRNPNQGRVFVRLKILRAAPDGGRDQVLYRTRVQRRIFGRQFSRSLIALPDLRPDDLIVISYRLRGMPRLQRYDAAYAETILRTAAPD